MISCWRWATWECLQGRASCSSHEAVLSPPPPGFIFNSFSFGVCHKSQHAQANVGVSAEHQPTASCAGHLHCGIIPLYSISELYFSGCFLRVPAQLYLGSLNAYSGHCSLPRCRVWRLGVAEVGAHGCSMCVSQPPSSGCCRPDNEIIKQQ